MVLAVTQQLQEEMEEFPEGEEVEVPVLAAEAK